MAGAGVGLGELGDAVALVLGASPKGSALGLSAAGEPLGVSMTREYPNVPYTGGAGANKSRLNGCPLGARVRQRCCIR